MAENGDDGFPPEGSDRGDGTNVIDLAGAARATLATRLKKQNNELDNLIDKYNSRYAVVNANGSCLVFEQKPDPLRPGAWLLHKFTFADFLKMHQNRKVHLVVKAPTIKDPSRYKEIIGNAAQLWLEHPRRREYLGGVVFDPARTAPREYFNLWTGYGVTPRRGSWHLMKDHVLKVVCGGNHEYYKYLINVAALMIQRPAEPAEVCVVLISLSG